MTNWVIPRQDFELNRWNISGSLGQTFSRAIALVFIFEKYFPNELYTQKPNDLNPLQAK